MHSIESYKLEDIVPLSMLKQIIDDLVDISGITISLANYKGETYQEVENHESFLCSEIRRTNVEGNVAYLCDKCDAFAGLEAARQGKPIIYKCHMGAAETAAPIIINDQYMGSLLAGQVILPEHEMEKINYIVPPLSKREIEDLPEDVQQAIANHKNCLKPYTMTKLKAVSGLLFNITNYIAQISYNNLIQKKLDASEKDLLNTKISNTQLEKNLAQTKLKSMQKQMNPHFLFNALNSIYQQSILENAENTALLIRSLSDILRQTIKSQEDIVSLSKELTFIKSYLNLMAFALGDRMKVTFDIDDECLSTKIPILTIQPFIENAINHGIEPLLQGGKIDISVKQTKKQRVKISVKDTGVGIPTETLDNLKTFESMSADEMIIRNDENPSKNLGIRNSICIMKQLFKDDFNWEINSSDNGTKIDLYIPNEIRY